MEIMQQCVKWCKWKPKRQFILALTVFYCKFCLFFFFSKLMGFLYFCVLLSISQLFCLGVCSVWSFLAIRKILKQLLLMVFVFWVLFIFEPKPNYNTIVGKGNSSSTLFCALVRKHNSIWYIFYWRWAIVFLLIAIT